MTSGQPCSVVGTTNDVSTKRKYVEHLSIFQVFDGIRYREAAESLTPICMDWDDCLGRTDSVTYINYGLSGGMAAGMEMNRILELFHHYFCHRAFLL